MGKDKKQKVGKPTLKSVDDKSKKIFKKKIKKTGKNSNKNVKNNLNEGVNTNSSNKPTPFRQKTKGTSDPSTKPLGNGKKFAGKKMKKKSAGDAAKKDLSSTTPTPPKPKKFKETPLKGQNGSFNSEIQQEVETKETKDRIKNFKKKSASHGASNSRNTKMVIKPGTGGKWYETSEDDPKLDTQNPGETVLDRKLARDEIAALRRSATELFDKDCNSYKYVCMQGDQKSDFQWMEKMMKVGTLPDRMAAYVVKIQDSPIHNLHHLQNLISMVKVQSKQQCIMAADTLKDLFLEDLLPPDKKLIAFDKRAPTLAKSDQTQLIKAVFEERIKNFYSSFIYALKRMSSDTVEKIRAKAVLIIYQLLSAHPEQESELLQMLVNKLGDPMKKVGSRGLFYLNSLLQHHPRMKLVVIDEVERLLFRNNIAKRAQYYGICFLNTINLENEHPEVACKLINLYVAFFKGCIKTGDIESKMMSALLTGVNKSYPLAKEYGFQFTENVDTLYKITHLSNFNIGVQALAILFQLTDVDYRPQDADRYYRVLYRELLRPEVTTTAHNLQFLNLVYRSMKHDKNKNRIMGFIKRLLQICQTVQPNLACSILYLISEVSKSHAGILNVGEVPEDAADDVIISEDENEGIDAEEEEAKKVGLMNLMKISNVKVGTEKAGNDSGESTKSSKNGVKKDVLDDNKEDINLISVVDLNKSDIICDDESEENVVEVKVEADYKQKLSEYDPCARNPAYSGAEFSLFYEIKTLTYHYHPSVSLFANELLRKRHIVYDGNPLKDFTTTRFLERFSYKNSKKSKSAPGAPRSYQPVGLRNIPVNSADYLKCEEDKIPIEERFFYRFHKVKTESTKQKSADDTSDTESVGDEEFDQLMADYFKTPKGKKFGEEDEDSDDLDFAADIHQLPKNKKGKGKNAIEDEEEDEDEEELADQDEGSDEDEEDFEADGDADEMLDMDDDDDDAFHDEDGIDVFENDEFDDEPMPKKKKKKPGKGSDMFAPAEQFAEMLESNADGGFSLTGPSTLVNRDNADPKQLKWEMDRDRWVKGYAKSSKSKLSSKKSPKRKRK